MYNDNISSLRKDVDGYIIELIGLESGFDGHLKEPLGIPPFQFVVLWKL